MDTSIPSAPPIVWIVEGNRGGATARDLPHVLEMFTVEGGETLASNRLDANPSAVNKQSMSAQLDTLAQGRRPAAIKTDLPTDAVDLRALVRCIDRLRAEDPLLAVVVNSRCAASDIDRDWKDGPVGEMLKRATLLTLNRKAAAALLAQSSIDDDAAIEVAAHALRERTGCRGIMIDGGVTRGNESGRSFMLTEQASGWLTSKSAAAAATAKSPATAASASDDHRDWFAASAAAALARGFVTADALVLAWMATTHLQRFAQLAAGIAVSADAQGGFALDRANLPGLLPEAGLAQPIRFAPLTQPRMDLYAVVDSAAWVQRVLDSGVRTVQLRIKDPAHPALREEIRQSVAAAKALGAQLFINDHWQLALEENAYGVHLGQEDLAIADLSRLASAGMRLGISTHAYWEVCRAVALQPSYIACGPIYPTAAKAMPWIPQGNDNLAYWCALLHEPVAAIAGMDFDRAVQAVQRGADAVAVISGITAADSPERSMQGFMQAIERARQLPRLPPPNLPRPTLARTA